MKLLLTRPAADSERMAEALAPLGAECLIWPLTRIVPMADRVEVPEGTEALLFTSPNGVRAFATISPRRDLPVLTVGDGTAAAAREAGFGATAAGTVASARGDARDLVRLVRASRWRRFLHLRGREAAFDLASELAKTGHEVAEAILYAADPAGPPPEDVARALAGGEVDLITIWSPRNGAILRDWLSGEMPSLDATDLLGISENAVAPLHDAGFRRIGVASRPDAAAMLRWISAALQP